MNMKKILIGAMLAVSAFSMMAESIARPMGGGRSIGRQSSNVSRTAPTPAQQAPRPAAAPAPAPAAPAIPPKPASPWKGILGGALLGLGVGALLSHFGMGGALGSMFGSIIMLALLAGAAFFIIRMIRNRSAGNAPAAPGAFGGGGNGNFGGGGFSNAMPQGAGATPEIGSRLPSQAFEPLQAGSSGVALDKPVAHTPWGVPADFDAPAFLRVAKSNFIRLQAAWDKGDVADIREFTTPEVFAELKMQISERGAQADFTDVVSIDAELLGIETAANEYLASVKFIGSIKSAPTAAAEPFQEVWNLSKPVSGGGGWMLAGIQQLS
ncbi:Tim44 domain-containing protein [Rugamonas sp. CCM 8940]|uniref:Tim44 domain-containing protein n=1 Tax=Rugamonas sp. CCM 8940 TaxID=2765359 RepID=UPI0018F7A31F|nr:Tim44-like domain-containing protein [Rugamonas sp. CCM 8940]MBJ7310338.1 Tim44 domain-containing protein [Rugamonas sp. CCM 8940]